MKNLLLSIAMIFSLTVMGRTERMVKTGENVPVNKSERVISISKEPIKMSSLPKAARQYLKENFPIRQVKEIYRIRNNGETTYEVGIKIEGKITVIRFDSNGEIMDDDI
jgi:adenine C2-methylase RlmN of 23S rRNA A2503 and tRNA A37